MTNMNEKIENPLVCTVIKSDFEEFLESDLLENDSIKKAYLGE